jgi:quercetin dioxygenase-like cupin family protein
MQRSQTADVTSLPYDRAKATVDFIGPHTPAPGLPPFQVRFRFAPGGAFDSFLHFHADHSEFLYCEKGRIRVTLGTAPPRMVGPEDGLIEIEPWMPHRWEVLAENEEETVVWEQSEPDPEMKELFFRSVIPLAPLNVCFQMPTSSSCRNIFNTFNDYNGNPPPLQVMKIFADYDNYPIGPQAWQLHLRSLIRVVVNAAGKIASWAGYHSVYKEYTPARLMARSTHFGLS